MDLELVGDIRELLRVMAALARVLGKWLIALQPNQRLDFERNRRQPPKPKAKRRK